MPLTKYYEDNRLIAEDRMREKGPMIIVSRPKKETKAKKPDRYEPFCAKKGVKDCVKRKGCLVVTMEFRQYLYEEWVQMLRERGWRWDHFRKCWYIDWTIENDDFAEKFVHGNDESMYREPDDVYFDEESGHWM